MTGYNCVQRRSSSARSTQRTFFTVKRVCLNKITLRRLFQIQSARRFPPPEVRILAPDKNNLVVTSQPTHLELAPGGFTDNVSFFVNVVFPTAGTYWVQTLANMVLLEEFPLIVTDAGTMAGNQPPEEISETVN